MKTIILFTGILIFMSITMVNGQTEKQNDIITPAENTLKPQVVINEKMVARYQDYVENGTYTSLWETVKEYNMDEMKEFYAAYSNHSFNEETTYNDIAEAVKKQENEDNTKPAIKADDVKLTASSENK